MSSAHAVLSPSAASRWLACTPSARLEQQFPNKSSSAADEGTLAHRLGELLINEKLGRLTKQKVKAEMKEITASQYYDAAMQEHADNYATYVLERFNEARARTSDAVLFTEKKLNLTDYIQEGFGTGDAGIIADAVLDLIDLKYGKGVPVSSVDNKQLMIYALGVLRDYDYMYDIQTVRITIYQPRLDNISEWQISVAELRTWAETVLKPKAEIAFAGKGEFTPGAHCQFCKAKARCRALANHNMELAQHDFKLPSTLDDNEVADILGKIDLLTSWAKSVSDHALEEALNGKTWPGFKVVEGRSNRKYTDEAAIVKLLEEKGFAEDLIYKRRELIGLTDMEKTIGKANFKDWLTPYTIKPKGSPALVPESDKRPAIGSTESAVNDFKDVVC